MRKDAKVALSREVMEAAKESRRRELRQLTKEYLAATDPAPGIIQNLKAILPRPSVIAAYRAKRNEINLDGLFTSMDYRFVFPRIDEDGLRFYLPRDMSHFVPGPHGLLEPDMEMAHEIALSQIDAVLVPGIGFDRQGSRLGRGRGYFDRALAGYHGLKIGVAAKVQVSDEPLPVTDFDVPMDVIVTDDFVLRLFKS